MNPPETKEETNSIEGSKRFVNDDNSNNIPNNMQNSLNNQMNSDRSMGQFPFQNNNLNIPENLEVSKDTIKNDNNPFSQNNLNNNPQNINKANYSNAEESSNDPKQNQNLSQPQLNYPTFEDNKEQIQQKIENKNMNNMAMGLPGNPMGNNNNHNNAQQNNNPLNDNNKHNKICNNSQYNKNSNNSDNQNNLVPYPNLDNVNINNNNNNSNKNNNEPNNPAFNNMNNNNNLMNMMSQQMNNNEKNNNMNMNMSNPQNQMNNMSNNNLNKNNTNNNQNSNMNNFGMQMGNNQMSNNNNNPGMQMNNSNQISNNQNNNIMNKNNMNNNNNNNNFGMPMSNFNNNNNNQNNSNMNNNNNFGMPMSNINNNNQMNNNNIGNQFSAPNMQKNNKGQYSFSRYTKAPKTGLKSLGETSYLNAVLQIFATNRTISSYFVNPTNKSYFETNKAQFPFTYVFHRLFTHFYPYPENDYSENYSPEVLLNVLGRYNKVYISKKSRNPTELLKFILTTLHKELNTKKTKYISTSDSTNKNQVLKEGLDDFQKSNNSIISNNFHWFELKSKFCSECKLAYYNFNNYEILDLDILGTFQQCNSQITLFHCLNYQSEKIQNSFCQKCQKYNQSKINTSIYSSPINFIFILNRGMPAQHLLNINFILEEKIDIGKFLENQQAYNKYELSGVVSFSVNENKYVCFGKSPVDNQWYLYNDDKVANTNINEVLNNNNNMQYIPCILLYHYMK